MKIPAAYGILAEIVGPCRTFSNPGPTQRLLGHQVSILMSGIPLVLLKAGRRKVEVKPAGFLAWMWKLFWFVTGVLVAVRVG